MNSQDYNYKIGPLGLGKINLNTKRGEFTELRTISELEKIKYSFRPNNAFFSLDLSKIKNPENAIIYNEIFVANDSSGIIKKIVLFVEGNPKEIIGYLDIQFQVNHVELKSEKYNAISRVSYLWHTMKETTVTLADLSDLYNHKIIQIEFVDNSNVDAVLTYSVIKLPEN